MLQTKNIKDMLNIIIFGAPGSGKGTQSELMKKHYHLAHISTGDVLRREIRNETPLGKIAKQYIDRGELVPDELICDMLDNVLETVKDSKGVIFDGFPRTVPQAEALETILAKRGWDITVLIDLQVEESVLTDRLLERGKSSGRSDDNEETIKSRLNVYHSQTAPLAGYYSQKGKHAPIDGVGRIEEIFNRIDKEISMRKHLLMVNDI
jgi:adenylate kinase